MDISLRSATEDDVGFLIARIKWIAPAASVTAEPVR